MKTTTITTNPQGFAAVLHFLDSRLGGLLCLGLFLLLLIGFSVKHLGKVSKIRPDHSSMDRSALLRWMPQLREMEKGVNIAAAYEYPNPPIMALFLLPLVHLNPLTASLIWFWVKVGLTGLGMYWMFHWIHRCRAPDGLKAPPVPIPVIVLTFLLSLLPVQGDLDHANVNLFILFLVLAALTAYHSRLDLLAGIIMGLAIACKVTPALFFPYWVWKRSWWSLLGCILGLVLFLYPGLVPAGILGWERNQSHVLSWFDGMVKPFVLEGKVTTELANQSIPGLTFRLTTHSPAETVWSTAENRYLPLKYINLMNLEPAQARLLVKGFMVLFVILVVCLCRTPMDGSGGWRLSAELGMVLLGMLLFSERTWKHHCVTLVVPFAVICYVLTTCQTARWLKQALSAILVFSLLLIACTSNGFLPERLSDLAMAYGAYTLANLLLLTALALLLWNQQQIEDPRMTC